MGFHTFLAIWSVMISFLAFNIEGKKCPGQCIQNVTDCNEKGGKIAGYCTNELACCDYSYAKLGTCGSKMSNLTSAVFQSPDYPEYISGDLVCQFDFVLNSNVTGLIVEYSDVFMDGPGFVKGGGCESDMLIFKGFPDWMPPAHCGSMENYSAVIDFNNHYTKGMQTFTIVALMSSEKYRWEIKVTQLYKKPTKPSIRIVSPSDLSTNEGEGHNEIEDEKSSTIDLSVSKITDSFEQIYEESEEEMHRILQLISSLTPYESRNNRIPTSNEDADYHDFPSEELFVVNGDDTKISKVPWQASLRKMMSPRFVKLLNLKNCSVTEGLHFCGGSIISERHILSAAHCFFLGNKFAEWERTSTIKVVLGDTDLCDEETEGIQEFKVEKVFYHYAYDDRVLLNDMVVIKLNRKIKFTTKVQPIKMAEEGMNFEHQTGFVSGWGRTNLTATEPIRPELLQSADDMFIGNSSKCIEEGLKIFPVLRAENVLKYSKYRDVFNSLVCTYTRDGDVPTLVGHGDSGGPLAVFTTIETITEKIPKKIRKRKSKKKLDKLEKSSKKKEALLVGVISYMIRAVKEDDMHDVSNYVDFYQNVPFYRRWIDLAMQ